MTPAELRGVHHVTREAVRRGCTHAVFDLDHTLIQRSSVALFVAEASREGWFSLWDKIKLPVFYLMYRSGRLGAETLEMNIPQLEGRSEEDIRRLGEKSFRERMLPAIFNAGQQIARSMRDAGMSIVIATTSLREFVLPFAEYFHADELVSSELAYQDGRATGRLNGRACFGDEKRRRVEELLQAGGHDLSSIVFFTDSAYDLPLFEAAGYAASVNPDRKLYQATRRLGRPALRFKSLGATT